MKLRILIPALVLFFAATPAFAQSEITCTLTTGSGSTGCVTTTQSTTSLNGTVVAPNTTATGTLQGTVTNSPSNGTLNGTVVAPATTGGGGGGSGGGGGGGGSGSNVIDICPNISGVQPTLAGYLMQNGDCIVATGGGSTGGTGGGEVQGTTTVPSFPDTGGGGVLPSILAILASFAAAAAGFATSRKTA